MAVEVEVEEVGGEKGLGESDHKKIVRKPSLCEMHQNSKK